MDANEQKRVWMRITWVQEKVIAKARTRHLWVWVCVFVHV